MRRALLSGRAVQPQIDGLFDARRRQVWERDFAALARGGITRINRAQHDQAIFARSLRRLFPTNAAREVGQLLRRAVIPEFLEDGIRPTLDRKSTRLNSSHGYISYAVFCLKKKNDDDLIHVQSYAS